MRYALLSGIKKTPEGIVDLSEAVITKYPYSKTDLRFDRKDVVWSATISDELAAEYGCIRVGEDEVPEYDHYCEELMDTAEIRGNEVFQTYLLRPLTEEERAQRIPQSITPLCALATLHQAGYSEAFEAWQNSPDRTFLEKAFLQRAQSWRRDNQVLIDGAASLGISSEELDQIFIAAAKLEAVI